MFHIDTAYESENEMWILGRTGESTSLSVNDVFTRGAYYLPRTKFEEYINPPMLDYEAPIDVKIVEIESYNKNHTHIGENTIALLKVQSNVRADILQAKFNVLTVEPCVS